MPQTSEILKHGTQPWQPNSMTPSAKVATHMSLPLEVRTPIATAILGKNELTSQGSDETPGPQQQPEPA